MYPSSFTTPHGCARVVSHCSAQLVETFGPDGKCLHQEVIIQRGPSLVQNMMTEHFFAPLLSHGRGLTTTVYPSKCSNVITSIYVSMDNPSELRCGIRAFYPKELNMHAQEAITQIDGIINTLEESKTVLNEHDTDDFDIDRKLNVIEDIADEVSEYISDQT